MKILIVLNCYLLTLTFGQRNESQKYTDVDVKCDQGQKISTIQAKFDRQTQYRQMQVKCQDLWNKDKLQNVQCKDGAPLKCDNSTEGCGKDQWLAGLRAVDVGLSIPILIPYCCSANNVKISDCQPTSVPNLNQQTLTLKVNTTSVVHGSYCILIKDRNSIIYDSILRFSLCPYTVDDSPVPADAQLGTESDFKGYGTTGSSGNEVVATTATPQSDQTNGSATTPSGQGITQETTVATTEGSPDSNECNCLCKCPQNTQDCSKSSTLVRLRRAIAHTYTRVRRDGKTPCNCTCYCNTACS